MRAESARTTRAIAPGQWPRKRTEKCARIARVLSRLFAYGEGRETGDSGVLVGNFAVKRSRART
jgi:hypothetical protein